MRKGKNKRTRYGFVFAALLLMGGAFLLARFFMVEYQIDNPPPPPPAPVKEVPKVRRAVDGVLVPEGEENPALVGVMVENMEEAQPISGIADAALVFEAVTEANITRFLAYFVLDGDIEIGPVRSARPYFLDWAAEFNTLYAHVGSSPAAYELLRRKGVEGVQDLDQWYNSQYFFRKSGKPKPHHLYTNTKLLGEAYKKSEFGMWKFKSDASPDLRGEVREITVGYIAPYEVTWVYDKALNLYKRVQWSGVHTTADGYEITAKNIAVAFQDMKILDKVGRKEFTTLGQGKGLVFQDGRVVVGTWRKPFAGERMRWYDVQGQEVEFNAGVTWIEVVPKGYTVRY